MFKTTALTLLLSICGALVAAPAAPQALFNMHNDDKRKICIHACEVFKYMGYAHDGDLLNKKRKNTHNVNFISFDLNEAILFNDGQLFILIQDELARKKFYCSFNPDEEALKVWNAEEIAKGRDDMHEIIARQKANAQIAQDGLTAAEISLATDSLSPL
jgi:hypothetical protein